VKVTGSRLLDVTLNRKGDRLLINLVNVAGHHPVDSVDVFDDLPSIGPLQVSVKCPAKPKSVRLQLAEIKFLCHSASIIRHCLHGSRRQ
jgi:uncharacterized protein YrrD